MKAIAEGTIAWEKDPDFGYEVASSVPGVEDEELLRPAELYRRTAREADYASLVKRFTAERREFLGGFPSLNREILAAV